MLNALVPSRKRMTEILLYSMNSGMQNNQRVASGTVVTTYDPQTAQNVVTRRVVGFNEIAIADSGTLGPNTAVNDITYNVIYNTTYPQFPQTLPADYRPKLMEFAAGKPLGRASARHHAGQRHGAGLDEAGVVPAGLGDKGRPASYF